MPLILEGKATGGVGGRAFEVIHHGGQAEGGRRESAEKLTWRVLQPEASVWQAGFRRNK